MDRRIYSLLAVALLALSAFLFLRTRHVETASTGEERHHSREAEAATKAAELDLAMLSIAEGEPRDALPMPVSEATPPTVAIPPSDLELLVASSAGAPVANAQVVIFRDEEILANATTDAEGLAKLQSSTGAAEAAVFAPGWVVSRAPVELEPGRRTITLPEGSILAGRVLVDGAAPTEPIKLQYYPSIPPWTMTTLPKRVLEHLNPALKRHGDLYAVTNDDGRFVFRGLLPNAMGYLEWRGTYFLDEPDTLGVPSEAYSVHVPELRSDLELRLTAGAELRLRVVDADGIPVPEARVTGTVTHEVSGQPTSNLRWGAADTDGRYRSSLGRKPTAKVEVRVARPDGFASVTREFPHPADSLGVWDLGDLAIAPLRTITVHVQDSEAAPIANALVMPTNSKRFVGFRSDVEGDLELRLGQDDAQILVLALAFESAIVDVPPGATEITAELSRSCFLELTLKNSEGVDFNALSVRVSGDPPLFTDEMRGGLASLPFHMSTTRSKAEGGTARFTTPAVDGRWKAAGLRPGVALKAELRSWNGPLLAHADIAPLEPGEHRIVELESSLPPKSLRVRVLDPDRTPLQAVKLHLSEMGESGEHFELSTSSHGVAEFTSLYADRFSLVVMPEAFSTQIIRGISVPPEELTIFLDVLQSIEVELVTLEGSPAVGQVEVVAGGEGTGFRRGEQSAPGRWVLKNLPLGEVSIRVSSKAFPEIRRLHQTSEPSVRIVVGGLGKITGRLKHEGYERPWGGWSMAISSEGSDVIQTRQVMTSGDEALQARFSGLPFGKYDVWLQTRALDPPCGWERVGSPMKVTLDTEHPTADLLMHP